MGALLIALTILLQQGEVVVVKHYGKRHRAGGLIFNAAICLFSTIFFFVTDQGGLVFPKELFLYGLLSCLVFASGFYSMYMALRTGSFVGATMISSFSGVISIGYGILFLKESAGIWKYLGILLVFASVFLMRYEKTPKRGEKKKGFAPWILWALLSAVSNGFISVISRAQQIYFENAYDNEFMILSFGGAFVLLLLLGMILERDQLKEVVKHGIPSGMGAGLFNGAKNFTTLLSQLYLPISTITPIRMGFGFIVSFLISVLLYKEKFTKQQIIAVILGVVSLLLFKI